MDESTLELLQLRLGPDINRFRFRTLIQTFGDFPGVQQAGPPSIKKLLRCQDEEAVSICRGVPIAVAHQEIERLTAMGGQVVTMHHPDYPPSLRQSMAPPPMLFVRGSIQAADQAAIAIIGSRKATAYGMAAAQSISASLAKAGLTIVSGFARGIDSAAHRAALNHQGRTLAILGCGLDVCYPVENRDLFQRLPEQGAFLSEYPLGTPPHAGHFPERNLLIASLTLGTVVMEAAERSGTLITSRLALEENRLLFALPGDVTRHNSRGTNRLIREGAILIQDGVDILRELAPQLRGILANWNLQDHVPESEEQDLRPGSTITKQSRNTPKETAAPSPTAPIQPELPGLAADAGQQTQPPNLEPELRTILGFILHEPLQFDDLAGLSREAGIPTGRLSSHLLKLELLGLVRQLPGRIYAAL